MISQSAKQSDQDPNRQDDHDPGDGTEAAKENDVTGTNQQPATLHSAGVSTKTASSRANRGEKKDANTKSIDRATKTARDEVASNDNEKDYSPHLHSHSHSYYFPSRVSSHSSHSNYYKLHYYHRSGEHYSQQYYHRYRHYKSRFYPPPLSHSAVDPNRMAPFDDTTLATSNISKDKDKVKKTSNRSLTIDTSRGDNHMTQRHEGCHRSFSPGYYPRSHPGFYLDGANKPHEQHFRFYEIDPAMEHDYDRDYDYEHGYGHEHGYMFSTTPIAVHTPQTSNTTCMAETRKRKEVTEDGHPPHHPNSNDAAHNESLDPEWKGIHNVFGYYKHYQYPHGSNYPAHGGIDHSRGRPSSKTKRSTKNRSPRSGYAPSHPPPHGNRHFPPTYYHPGWYSPCEYPPQAFPPHEPYDRHYFSPSPPPPPPYYPDYHTSSDKFALRAGSPSSFSLYESGSGSFDEQDAPVRAASMPYYPPYSADDRFYSDPPSSVQDEKQRPGTPSSNHSVKRIPEVTPGRSTTRQKARPHFSSKTGNAVVTPGDKHNTSDNSGASTFAPSSPFVALRDSDIVCGRGAPTNFHIGNTQFRELVLEYHRSYFVAKRSEKPRIAMEVLDVLSNRGARFVRRVKGRGSTAEPHWEEVANKVAYEKVCQALRDAITPPRRMLSAAAALRSPSPGQRSGTSGNQRDTEDLPENNGTSRSDEKENDVVECF